MPRDVIVAQLVTAATTVFYAAVFAVGYYLLIKRNRETLKGCARHVSPGPIADSSRGQLRSPGDGGPRGAKRHWRLRQGHQLRVLGAHRGFGGFVISDLRYHKHGMDFLRRGNTSSGESPLLYEGSRSVPRQQLEELLLALEKVSQSTSGGMGETSRALRKTTVRAPSVVS